MKAPNHNGSMKDSKHSTGRIQNHRSEQTLEAVPFWRCAISAVFVIMILGIGLILSFGDFWNRPDITAEAIPIQMSMAGFDPLIIPAKAGEELTLDLWTTDTALHLEGGVHTLINDDLDIYEELPAESRKTVKLQIPTTPGDYDIYCNTCCGGKANPTMHGVIRVEV